MGCLLGCLYSGRKSFGVSFGIILAFGCRLLARCSVRRDRKGGFKTGCVIQRKRTILDFGPNTTTRVTDSRENKKKEPIRSNSLPEFLDIRHSFGVGCQPTQEVRQGALGFPLIFFNRTIGALFEVPF